MRVLILAMDARAAEAEAYAHGLKRNQWLYLTEDCAYGYHNPIIIKTSNAGLRPRWSDLHRMLLTMNPIYLRGQT